MGKEAAFNEVIFKPPFFKNTRGDIVTTYFPYFEKIKGGL
jgi:hypothetical protein